ncbi:hypothetical protein [Bradyrhizobium sp. SRS-191]|uniref:hypothetical protein n=1 Tax=Bradyrhizobium sp. SRS-191 TaxID=2962606 RepID=UPI00211EAC65|nr:hypothetical protein [Bradyrhizobium sp. SRS-191]
MPRECKVIQHAREKFSCRACEVISRPPGAIPSDLMWTCQARLWRTSCSPSTGFTCRSIGRAELTWMRA